MSREVIEPRWWKGTLTLSWGSYGGFYVHPRRVCLGWVALTLVPRVEIDDLMAGYLAGTKEAGRR
jgi:hypothetical protein